MANKSSIDQNALYVDIIGQTEEQKRQMALGDNDFVADISQYMPSGVRLEDIDPAIARLHAMPRDKKGNEMQYSLRANSTSKNYAGDANPRFPDGKGGITTIPIDPGTVNAFGAANANLPIWAHEYRHQLDVDGGGEVANRIRDLMAARTPTDWEDSVNLFIDSELFMLQNKFRRAKTKKEQQNIQAQVDKLTSDSKEVRDEYVQSMFRGRNSPYSGYVSGNGAKDSPRGIEWRQRILGEAPKSGLYDPSIIDKIKSFMPDGFREGGRVKLI